MKCEFCNTAYDFDPRMRASCLSVMARSASRVDPPLILCGTNKKPGIAQCQSVAADWHFSGDTCRTGFDTWERCDLRVERQDEQVACSNNEAKRL